MVGRAALTADEWRRRSEARCARCAPPGAACVAGVAELQGWRDSMEDAHVLAGLEGRGLFGLFDGHGGSAAADFAARELAREAAAAVRGGDDGAAVARGLAGALLAIDQRLRAEVGADGSLDEVGSTAVAAVVDRGNDFVAAAWLGDSVGVVCRGGRAMPLGRAHCPNEAGEFERLSSRGGFVFKNRVNGRLAVSRALGDFCYKDAAAAPEDMLVTPVADTVCIEAADVEFVVLACDGLWDTLTVDQCARLVEHAWRRGVTAPEAIARKLVHCALLRGSKDNITCVVVVVDGDALDRRLVDGDSGERGAASPKGSSLLGPLRDLPLDAPTFDRVDASAGPAPAPAAPVPEAPAAKPWSSQRQRAQTPQRPNLSPAALEAAHALAIDDRPIGRADVERLDAADVARLLVRMGLGEYRDAFAAVDGAALVLKDRHGLVLLGMAEVDSLYLCGAINLWMNLRFAPS